MAKSKAAGRNRGNGALKKPDGGAPGRQRTISLALQGGGAHGAFTWGVLERLLEEESLAIEGISGTSAGAMNAAVLACGLAEGGREGAVERLALFWRRVADYGRASPFQPTPVDHLTGNWNMDDSPAYMVMDLLSRVLSPYQLNPLNINPLRSLLEQTIDFHCLQHCRAIKLFISATNVRTGKIQVFTQDKVTVDTLLASACVPQLFQAVEVEGEPYWDGGFTGNPALYPLIYDCAASDIVLVQINPLVRPEVPTSAREILDRVNEISFNATLMREMRSIAFVTRLIDQGKLNSKEYRRIYMHLIEAEDEMRALGFSSKLVASWEFISHLRELGYRSAERWLSTHGPMIGQQSSVDIEALFL